MEELVALPRPSRWWGGAPFPLQEPNPRLDLRWFRLQEVSLEFDYSNVPVDCKKITYLEMQIYFQFQVSLYWFALCCL